MKCAVPPTSSERRFEPVDAAKLVGSRLPVVASIARNAAQVLRDPYVRWGPNNSWGGRTT